MAETNREASVRLTLDGSDFIVSIKGAGDAVAAADKKIKQAQSSWSAGFQGAGKSIGALASQVGTLIKTAGGLAGAFSIGAAAQRAVGLREQFRDLEYQINKTGRANVEWGNLLKVTERAAADSGQKTEELGKAYSELFSAVGDEQFAGDAIRTIGLAAKATGKDLNSLTGISGMLFEKFGADAKSLPDLLSIVLSKTNEGGLALEDMGSKFGLLAGEAKDAGFAGADGLSSVLGMLNMLDDRLGDKSIPAFKKLFQTLKDGSSSLAGIEKASGLKLEGKDGADKLRTIMGSAKAREAVQGKLGGELRVVFDELSRPFIEAAENAKKHGASVKDATFAGLYEFDAAMKQAGDIQLSGADLLEKGLARAAEDPRAKLDRAVDKITAAFMKPELLDAIDKLADKMPALAEWIGKLVSFAVDHPGVAAAGAVGAVGAKGAAGALLSGIDFKSIIWSETGARGAGKVAGDELAKTAGAGLARGGLTAAGKVFAAVAAAEIGYELGKVALDNIIDPQLEATDKGRNTIALANAASAVGVPTEQKKKALDAAKAELARLEQAQVAEQKGVSFSKYGAPIAGGGIPFKSAALKVGNALGLISDEEYADTTNAPAKDIARAKARVQELEQQISTAEKPTTPDYITNPGAYRDPKTTQRNTKTNIENTQELGLALARALATTKLNVVVSNPVEVSRGPIPIGGDTGPREWWE